MQLVWADFETFWADDFSLRKITPIEYVSSPRFEALGCAFVSEDSAEWVDGPDLPDYFAGIDWSERFVVSHNALFDATVLAVRYGVVPGWYGCTLSMARNWLSHQLKSLSLDSVSKFYGLPPKMDTVLKTKGVNFQQLRNTPSLHEEVKTYAIDDANKCRTIFTNMLKEGFPQGELETIDMVIRMATQPKFELDGNVLAEHLAKVKSDKQGLLDAASLDRENLSSIMSDQQLAAKLLFLGVQPPTKISRTTGKEAFAFAKTDKEFTALLEHPKPMVQALVAARLGHKSTLEETRTERLLSISRSVEQMPVPLKYSGAHTHRFSGDWKINLQNLVRGSEIRRAFKAPRDHVVVSVDASQIEARFNATVAGQTDLMEAFRQGRDVYAEFAQDIYGYEITKETFPDERFVGKTGILSLGYGSSWPVFQNMCRVKGGVTLPDGAAAQVVTVYRARYHMIQELWKTAHQSIIPRLASSRQTDFAELLPPGQSDGWNMWGPAQVLANALLLPNGNRLRYMNLRAENHDGQWNWLYERSEQTFKLYGAKLVENLIQALAFVHIMEVALRVKHLTNGMLMPAHQVHDELIYVVHAGIAGMVRDLVVKEMSTPPSWLPKAPLAAEGHIGESYGNVK